MSLYSKLFNESLYDGSLLGNGWINAAPFRDAIDVTVPVDGNGGIWMSTMTVMADTLFNCAGAVVVDWPASLAITQDVSMRQGSSWGSLVAVYEKNDFYGLVCWCSTAVSADDNAVPAWVVSGMMAAAVNQSERCNWIWCHGQVLVWFAVNLGRRSSQSTQEYQY